jgi:hypothetical protein
MSKNLQMALAIIAVFGACFGAYEFLEKAQCADIKMIEQRLDWKILADQLKVTQDRIWTLEDRYKGKVMPESVKEEYRVLQEDKKRMEFKLTILEKENK